MAIRVPLREGLFIDDPNGAKLLANKCKECGQIHFPKSDFCLKCLHSGMEEIALSRKGILYSYTIGHMASMNFSPPYAIGFVDLPEGVRIFAPLKLSENKPLKIGMEMQLIIDDLWKEEDREIFGYKFEPIV